MKIGIDAKWFFTGPVSSRIVLQNILPELLALFPEHEWHIFLDRRDKALGFPVKSPGIQLHYVWADINMLANVFLLSGKIKPLRLDAFVYQTFPSLRQIVPAISFEHDVLFRDYPQYFGWKERLYFYPLRWLTRNRSQRLIATTQFVKHDLLKYRYTSDKSRIDLVPLGVSDQFRPLSLHDPEKVALLKKTHNLPDRFLLFVGRLNVRKNIDNLLKAMPLLRDKRIKLVIVGKPDWKSPDLAKLLSDSDIAERIVLTGALSDEELTLIYPMANVFCFPSFAEGFGLPPVEAIASGVPVVVSKTTAMPEVCGDAALYIDPQEPGDIAKAIDSLLEDSGLHERQRLRGLDRAASFTWQRSAAALMESIRKLEN